MTATGYQITKRKTTEALKAELGKAPEKVVISLPWPPKEVSPNARVHWTAKAKAAKAYQQACWIELICNRKPFYRRERFKITFRAPDKRGRDTDNMIASIKKLIDALSIVTGVNELQFEITYVRGEPVQGGAVEVEVIG